jgi:CheY-like chemotaxis protein
MIESPRTRMLEGLATRLLYVEDDDDFREIIAGAFVDAGFDVTSMPSAEEALEELATGAYDVVVTDFHLTGETGGWLLATAEANGYLERTAAVVLTAERRPHGVDGYRVLRKPVALSMLLSAITEAVGAVAPASVVSVGAARPAELELVLYVTRTSQESHKAIRNVHRALRPFAESRFRLTICDVGSGGDEAWCKTLEDDHVIVTPTLVKKRPGPKTWIVGSFGVDLVEDMVTSVLGTALPS